MTSFIEILNIQNFYQICRRLCISLKNACKQCFLLLIHVYRLFVSPFIGSNCRFEPTCSKYALEAFENRGVFKALWLTLVRILSCNPFSKGGYDPVPLRNLDGKQ